MAGITMAGNFHVPGGVFLPPDVVDLDHWHFFGVDAAYSAKNHPFGAVASVVGVPVFNAGYATFQPGVSFVQTQTPQRPDATYFSVFKVTNESTQHLLSNFASPAVAPPNASSRGISLSVNAGGTPGDNKLTLVLSRSVLAPGVGDTAVIVSLADSVNRDQWTLVAGRVDAAGGLKIWNLTAGTSATAASANPVNTGSALLRVGSSYTTPSADPNSQGLSVAYRSAKTDAQVLKTGQFLKDYFAAVHGIGLG